MGLYDWASASLTKLTQNSPLTFQPYSFSSPALSNKFLTSLSLHLLFFLFRKFKPQFFNCPTAPYPAGFHLPIVPCQPPKTAAPLIKTLYFLMHPPNINRCSPSEAELQILSSLYIFDLLNFWKAVEQERLEISLRKLEIPRKYFIQRQAK